jgi:Fe-S-cluster containining protein
MARWLSFHVPYACRHSGACCSSGWDIAVETSRVPAIAQAVDDARIAAPAKWFRSVDHAPADIAGVLALGPNGHCVFHEKECAVHRALGHAAIPAACQHFPRVVLIDPRGVFVTLSHYCPTAASLLVNADRAVSIVEGPPALPGATMPEGLDAREALPPLRSPRMLMDWDGYSAWEREAVHALTTSENADEVLDWLAGRALATSDEELFETARASVPAPYAWPAHVMPHRDAELPPAVVGRYLAAHAFACWMAYHGNGLASIAVYVRLALAVLRAEVARRNALIDGIRQSDLLLRHLVDREILAARINRQTLRGRAHDRSSRILDARRRS